MDYNIVTLLQKYSGEIVVAAFISNLISLLISKLFKTSSKVYTFVSFFLGAIIYSLLAIFVLKENIVSLLANSLTCGALSSVLCIFIKRFVHLSGEDIRQLIEKLLSSIVLSEQLDEVVDGIIKKLKENTNFSKDNIVDYVRDSISMDCSEEELDKVCSFIFEALVAEKTENTNDENSDKENKN